MTPFALLFLLVLVILLVGVGSKGIQSPVQGIVFVFIIMALVASVIMSLQLARTQRRDEDVGLQLVVLDVDEPRSGDVQPVDARVRPG